MIPANYSTISFPSLGIEVNPGRALALGPLTIHYYGLIIAIGLMLAVVYACRRCSQFGIKQDDLLDGVLWVTPFAILCARAYYCIFSWADYAENPISVLYIWNGGLAIYGGVLGAVAGILLLCRIKKIKIGALLDSAGLSHRPVHWPVGQLRQPGSLRRGDGQLLPHGAVQHRHRRMGILPPDVFVRVGVERRGLCAAALPVQASAV